MKKIFLVLLAVFVLSLVGCDRYVVSEEKWNKAFSLESFSNVTFVITIEKSGKSDFERVTIKADNGKYLYLSEKIHNESIGFKEEYLNYYYTDSNGKTWEYYKSTVNDKWDIRLANNRALTFFQEMIDAFGNNYQLFEYDNNNKTYLMEDDGQYTVSFIDGKVSQITEIEYKEDYNNIYTYQVIDYGKTTVELPLVN